MKRLTRLRTLMVGLGFAALTPLLQGASVGLGPSFKGPIGLQLYSLRAQFTKSPPAAAKVAAGFGIHEVETAGTYGWEPAKFRALLTEAGLNPISGHFPFESFEKDPAKVATEAKALGLKYAGCAWIPHEGDFKEADARRAIAVFNRAGAELRKQGIQVFYHVHGYEFQKFGDGYLLDLLIRECSSKDVTFEMDTTWIFFPGQNPAAWLKKYPGRWQLIHLKDLKKGVVTGALTGSTDPNNDVPLGTGQLDWPSILKAAQEAGVKHYFIEDEAALAADQIPASLRFLEQVRW